MTTTCPICLDEKELIPLETCSHGICAKCIIPTLRMKDNCPVCRKVWCPEIVRAQEQPGNNMSLQNELQRVWLNSIHRSSSRENDIYHSLTGVLMNSLINDFLERDNGMLSNMDVY